MPRVGYNNVGATVTTPELLGRVCGGAVSQNTSSKLPSNTVEGAQDTQAQTHPRALSQRRREVGLMSRN